MTDKTDIELPYGGPDESSQNDYSSVSELIKKCVQDVSERALKYMAQAEYNERLCNGEPGLTLSPDYQVVPDESWPDWLPKNSRNLLRNLRLTWSSRILEDRPAIACYPAEPGADQRKAEVASRVLEYKRQNQDFDDLCFQAAELVQPHSVVGFKAVWDPLSGPVSAGIPMYSPDGFPVIDFETGLQQLEGVGEVLGDVAWEVVSIFDYGTDGAENIENSKWCYFMKHMDEWDAYHLLRSAGITEKVDVKSYTDIWGVKKSGAEVIELWWRPDYRFPDGLYAVMVCGHVVQAGPFPYEHKELPLAVWKCGNRRGSSFGSTHVDDAVYIQRTINEIVAAMSRQARQIRDIKLLAHDSVLTAIESGSGMIPCNDPNIANSVRYLEPPDRARVLVSSLEDNIQALYTVFGLNEMLTGADNLKSGTAAKSIAYLNKLDSMKMSGASRSLGKAILRVMRQTLKLYQQYVKAPRLAQIAGSVNLGPALEFTGADIAGVDVRLESATGYDAYRATVAQEANDRMAQTGPTSELQSQGRTGLRQTAFDKSQREVVQAQIQMALKGQQVQADSQVDANVAMDEIVAVMSQYFGTPVYGILQQLLMGYKQAAKTQQADAAAIAAAEGEPQ